MEKKEMRKIQKKRIKEMGIVFVISFIIYGGIETIWQLAGQTEPILTTRYAIPIWGLIGVYLICGTGVGIVLFMKLINQQKANVKVLCCVLFPITIGAIVIAGSLCLIPYARYLIYAMRTKDQERRSKLFEMIFQQEVIKYSLIYMIAMVAIMMLAIAIVDSNLYMNSLEQAYNKNLESDEAKFTDAEIILIDERKDTVTVIQKNHKLLTLYGFTKKEVAGKEMYRRRYLVQSGFSDDIDFSVRDSIFMLNRTKRRISGHNPVCGIMYSEQAYKLRIDGQPVDQVIPVMVDDRKAYVWYIYDLITERNRMKVDITYE